MINKKIKNKNIMIHQIQQEEKERVIENIREWLIDHIHEREFDYMNGYYNLCVTSFDTETNFWNEFNDFVKTL